MIARFTGSGLLAAGITFGLLAFMQFLIGREQMTLEPPREVPRIAPFWEGDPELVVPDDPPKPVLPEVVKIDDPGPVGPVVDTDGITWQPERHPPTGPDNRNGPDIIFNDAVPSPIFQVQHRFPRRAISAGLAGCAIYGFTISKTGGTKDIYVIDSTSVMFEGKGAEAIAQYRYKPQMIAGKPVETPNQSIRLAWEIEGESLPDHPACR